MAAQEPSDMPRLSRDSSPGNPQIRTFVGRAFEKSAIKKAVQSPKKSPTGQCRFVITGKSGQGKTALCEEVVEELRRVVSGVFWVDASTPATAQQGFAEISSSVGSTKMDINSGLQCLGERKGNWILILDNANDPRFTYEEYFPPCAHGFVVIISRELSVTRYETAGKLVLRGLTSADSVQLLQNTIYWPLPQGSDEAYWAEQTAILVENHALSLVLAGACIAKRRCPFELYVSEYENLKREIQTNQTNPTSQYTNEYTVCELSAQTLTSGSGQAALALLCNLSRRSCRPIPIETARAIWTEEAQVRSPRNHLHPPAHHPPSGASAVHPPATPPSFESALERLSSLAFLAVSPDSIAIHPVIRSWAQDLRRFPHAPSSPPSPPSRDRSRSASSCPRCRTHFSPVAADDDRHPDRRHSYNGGGGGDGGGRGHSASRSTRGSGAATTTARFLYVRTAPPSPHHSGGGGGGGSREPSPFRKAASPRSSPSSSMSEYEAYTPQHDGDDDDDGDDGYPAREGRERRRRRGRRAKSDRRRSYGNAAHPVRFPYGVGGNGGGGGGGGSRYFGEGVGEEVEGEEGDLGDVFSSDDEEGPSGAGSDREECATRRRYLRVVDEPVARRHRSRSRGDGEAAVAAAEREGSAEPHGGGRRRRRRRRSRLSHSSDGRLEENAGHRDEGNKESRWHFSVVWRR